LPRLADCNTADDTVKSGEDQQTTTSTSGLKWDASELLLHARRWRGVSLWHFIRFVWQHWELCERFAPRYVYLVDNHLDYLILMGWVWIPRVSSAIGDPVHL
jgi:hypothetical protein